MTMIFRLRSRQKNWAVGPLFGLAVYSFAVTHSVPAAEPELLRATADSETESIEISRGRTARASIPMKIRRYCHRIISKHDMNGDGVLQEHEWRSLPGDLRVVDANGDHDIDLDELTKWTAEYGMQRKIGVSRELPQPIAATSATEIAGAEADEKANSTPATAPTSERRRDLKFFVPEKRLPAGLPDWFFARDEDGDAQLTIAEFSPTGSGADIAEFARYDANRDGVMTARECVGRAGEKSESTKAAADASAGGPTLPTPSVSRRKPLKKLK
jgi:hypothetical protein